MVALGFRTTVPPSHRPETEAERALRVEREATIVAQAKARIAAGLGIDDDDLEQWLDDLDRDDTTPLPAPRSSGSAAR